MDRLEYSQLSRLDLYIMDCMIISKAWDTNKEKAALLEKTRSYATKNMNNYPISDHPSQKMMLELNSWIQKFKQSKAFMKETDPYEEDMMKLMNFLYKKHGMGFVFANLTGTIHTMKVPHLMIPAEYAKKLLELLSKEDS